MRYLIEIESEYDDLNQGENLDAMVQHLLGFMGIDRITVLSTLDKAKGITMWDPIPDPPLDLEQRIERLEAIVETCGLTPAGPSSQS